ncbi:sensor protein [Haloterrigena salina JCM 13891]|uniref:Sensor protein n=1 Tax=Haloterrigena salina JCM 13891 TaxID=1227488 RepID=M0CN94_9EURY|nr:sensor domain-containing protein [Haloterrigena salina]ELZ23344.1 sensor protein [Haloterrigena salina JCM 13891]
MSDLSTIARGCTTEPNTGPDPDENPLRWFFGVPFRTRTYLNLLYLLLAFPLGLLYFIGVTTGFALGVGLLITLLGIPLLVMTLIGATILAAFDARLTARLAGFEAPVPESLRAENPRSLFRAEDGFRDALEELVTAPTTWTSLLLLVAKFCYGVVAFTVVLTAGTLVVALLATPFVYSDPTISYTVGVYVVDSLPEAIAVASVGVCGGFLALHVCNGLAAVGGYLTTALLDDGLSQRDTDAIGDRP